MEKKYLIWSSEHHAWWKPNASGYTTRTDKAGQYGYEEARKIVDDANEYAKPYAPEEIMVEAPRRSMIDLDLEHPDR